MWRLVATVATRNDGVTELVLGQTFAGSTRERVCRASSGLSEVTIFFVFTVGTLNFPVTQSRFRNTFSTAMTFEWLRRTLSGCVSIFGHWKSAFFVGSILLKVCFKRVKWNVFYNLRCNRDVHHKRRTSWCKFRMIGTEFNHYEFLTLKFWKLKFTWKVPSAHPVFPAEQSLEIAESLEASHSQILCSLQKVFGSDNWHCLSL